MLLARCTTSLWAPANRDSSSTRSTTCTRHRHRPAAAAHTELAFSSSSRRSSSSSSSVWCRAAADGDGVQPEQQQQQQQAPRPAVVAAGWSFTPAEQRALWDAVSRPLLRLGRAGVTDTHARSLAELLAAHTLVKVQVNGARNEAVAAIGDGLEAQAGDAAVLLQVKGSTLLFGRRASSQAELLAVAEAEAASTAVWKAKRRMQRAESEAAAASGGGGGGSKRAASSS